VNHHGASSRSSSGHTVIRRLNLLRRILFYPFGNNVDNVSLYLQRGNENGQEPENWYTCAQFGIVLWSPSQPSKFVSHGWAFHPSVIGLFLANADILVAHHRFNVAERDWGFTRFWDGHQSPLDQNEDANITAYVRVVKDPTGVLWHSFQEYVPLLLIRKKISHVV
jgi:ubiquitin carboxyl-terminal hydrolase 7